MKKFTFLFAFLFIVSITSNLHAQWVQIPNGMFSLQTKVNCFITNGNNIFAGTDNPGGFYASSNNGSNWSHYFSLIQTVHSFASNSNYMFMGYCDSGVYRSTNGGFFWLPTSIPQRNYFAIAANGNNIFAGTDNLYFSFYFSSNNGTTWIHSLFKHLFFSCKR